MLTVRCKDCNKELTSHTSHARCCGCSNMTTVIGDKITAVDLSRVIMINSPKEDKKTSVFTPQDLAFQEARRQRKVRRLDFEVR